MSILPRRIRVRAGHNYAARYTCHVRSPQVDLVTGPLIPHARFNRRWDNWTCIRPGYDLIHSLNAVPLFGRTPFVLSFEDYLPRVPPDRPDPWMERYLRRQLLSPRCLGVVALSDYALRKVAHQHRDHPDRAALLARTRKLAPNIPGTDAAPKPAGDRLRLLFVGKDFLRKGGAAVVEAHRRLAAMGVPVETTIVSALRWRAGDYVGPPDAAGAAAAHARIAATPGIVHHAGLAHAETLRLMRAADYLLLPTFHDTYGYVTAEALWRGTPAIVTDTCAQPEIVEHGRSGFLLPFDNDDALGEWRWLYRNADPDYAAAYWAESDRLAARIVERLAAAWEARRDYEGLSAGALARAAALYDEARFVREMEALYLRAL